jgi:2-dehydro-3-deoxyphosphogalactonate aldolase
MSLALKLPLIAILRGIAPEDVLAHVDVLVEEGWEAVEIPLTSPDWQQSIELAVQHHGEHLCLGGGTVLTHTQVEQLAGTGGRLMLTANTHPRVIRHGLAQNLTVVAGFATASEAFSAIAAGAQALKLFPAVSYGPAHLRALRVVLPALPIYVAGGVSTSTLARWAQAGCAGAGIGGELYRAGQDVARTRRQARAYRDAWQEASASTTHRSVAECLAS